MIGDFTVLLLDLHDTLMFSGDRFEEGEDFGETYRSLGGHINADMAHGIVRAIHDRLRTHYAVSTSVWDVRDVVATIAQGRPGVLLETERLAHAFALHEVGRIPPAYATAVRALARNHRLAIVSDIWSARPLWDEELERVGLADVFDAVVFSSEFGIVKPSPRPFLEAFRQLGVEISDAIVIGDSADRDGEGAIAAGLPFILVGTETHPLAYAQVPDFLHLAPYL